MKLVDLFSGTGAFAHVAEKHDIETVFSNDIEPSSQAINALNFRHRFVLQDLNTIDCNEIPAHDILCGGFPCQPFSIAGKQEGFEDTRSNVFWKTCEIIKYHNPRILLLENVKNLKSHDKGNTFKIILSKLQGLGYHIKYKVFDTSQVTGIPHHRERIYIVGFRDRDECDAFNFDFPSIECRPLSDFLEKSVSSKYYYTEKLKVYEEVRKAVVKKDTIYQYRRYYVRENKSGCCPTLTANMGSGGHNVPLLLDKNEIRKLTPRECFNLQGFPSDYKLPKISDSKLYMLAGNAVTIPVIDLIISKISKFR